MSETKIFDEWFGDVQAVLELFEDAGEPRSSLFLYYTDVDGAQYFASLQLCEHMGGIPYSVGGPDEGPELYALTDAQFDEIESWAVDNGY